MKKVEYIFFIGLINKSFNMYKYSHNLQCQEWIRDYNDFPFLKVKNDLYSKNNVIKFSIQHLENKIVARLEQMAATQKEEFARLKRECREGFSTVHESITNMKTVMEGKRKILEDQLRKEISQIRKMVVLV